MRNNYKKARAAKPVEEQAAPRKKKVDPFAKRSGKNRRDQHKELIKASEEYKREQKRLKNERDGGMWTKSEDVESMDRIEGRNPVLEALRSGVPINKLVIAKGQMEGVIKQIYAIAKDRGIVIQEIDRDKMDYYSETGSHQGVMAYLAAAEYVEVDDILRIALSRGEQPFVIVLDEISDPQNLGAILRTADAAGAHGVIIPKRRAVGLTAAVAKASAGAVNYVPVARVANISRTLDELKKAGLWVTGTDADGQTLYTQGDYVGPTAIVIGSEGQGMSKLVKENCDYVVRIPMKGKVNSLNASAATALLLYEVVKQRM